MQATHRAVGELKCDHTPLLWLTEAREGLGLTFPGHSALFHAFPLDRFSRFPSHFSMYSHITHPFLVTLKSHLHPCLTTILVISSCPESHSTACFTLSNGQGSVLLLQSVSCFPAMLGGSPGLSPLPVTIRSPSWGPGEKAYSGCKFPYTRALQTDSRLTIC